MDTFGTVSEPGLYHQGKGQVTRRAWLACLGREKCWYAETLLRGHQFTEHFVAAQHHAVGPSTGVGNFEQIHQSADVAVFSAVPVAMLGKIENQGWPDFLRHLYEIRNAGVRTHHDALHQGAERLDHVSVHRSSGEPLVTGKEHLVIHEHKNCSIDHRASSLLHRMVRSIRVARQKSDPPWKQ